MDAYGVLVIILSITLAIFLILAIVAVVLFIRFIRDVNTVTADIASISTTLRKAVVPATFIKIVTGAIKGRKPSK